MFFKISAHVWSLCCPFRLKCFSLSFGRQWVAAAIPEWKYGKFTNKSSLHFHSLRGRMNCLRTSLPPPRLSQRPARKTEPNRFQAGGMVRLSRPQSACKIAPSPPQSLRPCHFLAAPASPWPCVPSRSPDCGGLEALKAPRQPGER